MADADRFLTVTYREPPLSVNPLAPTRARTAADPAHRRQCRDVHLQCWGVQALAQSRLGTYAHLGSPGLVICGPGH
jgi:hypothetical protein